MEANAWEQLNRRLDEQHGHVLDRLDQLQTEARELRGGLELLRGELDTALREHACYHRTNEHHWGPERLAQRHPFRTALLAALLAWVLFALTPESLELVSGLLRQWLR